MQSTVAVLQLQSRPKLDEGSHSNKQQLFKL